MATPEPLPIGGHARWRASWPFLLAAGAVLLRVSIGSWPIDDSYITFRHSRNLLDGTGFVFNPGQTVLGTSTPLYGLLLALLGWVVRVDVTVISLAVNAIADGCIVILLCAIGRRVHVAEWAVALLALSWAFYPLGIRYSVGGMEASVAGATLLAACLAHVSGRNLLVGVLIALATLFRPELMIVAGVLGADMLRRRRALPWGALCAFVIITGTWVTWASAVYGSPLPQSIQAKTHDVYTASPWRNTKQIRDQAITLLSNNPSFAASGIMAGDRVTPKALEMVGLALAIGLCGLGVLSACHANARIAAVFVGVAVVIVSYALASFRGSLIAEWYLIPLTPLVWFALVCGLARVTNIVGPVWTPLVWLAGATIVAIQITGLNLGRDESRPWWIPRVVWTEREELYKEAAAELKTRAQSADVVAAPEIGALGYFCDCRILDTVGLVSPEALKYYPLPPGSSEINNAIPAGLVREERPRYVVTLDVFVRGTLLNTKWFQEHYRVVWQRETPVFLSRALIIFEYIPDMP